LHLTLFLPGKFTFYDRVLKSDGGVTFVRKAADAIRITFFKSFGVNKVNELIVRGNKLTRIFTGVVPDDARGS
jgi:hypothetical protein